MKERIYDKESIYDIESSGLELSSQVYSIGSKLIERGEVSQTNAYTCHYVTGSDGELDQAREELLSCDRLIGFNNISFDGRMLEHLWDTKLPEQLDLLIAAKIIFPKDHLFAIDNYIEDMPPKLKGSFSLKAFGYRFGDRKIEFEDWSHLSAEMVTYNKQDVDLTYRLYQFLIQHSDWPSDHVLDIEHFIGKILAMQTSNGFYFNIDAARKLYASMCYEMLQIERTLKKKFRPLFLPDSSNATVPEKAFKRKEWLPNPSFRRWTAYSPYDSPISQFKNGKIKFPKKPSKWFDEPMRFIIKLTVGAHQPITLTEFSPGSRRHIQIWLEKHFGWEPIVFTARGNPKIDYDTLGNMDYEEGELLKRYLKLVKDSSQLMTGEGSLINNYDPDTHAIHHQCDGMGTNTGRMSHSGPNISQVPATRSFRQLFYAPEGYSIVGADLSGQELRVLAHFIYPYDGGAYAEAVLSGKSEDGTDIHTMNMKAAGLKSRDEAKTMIYGILYGSSSTRIGYSLWIDGETTVEYTDAEFDDMKAKLIRRIDMARNEGNIVDTKDGGLLFPIAKDMYVPMDDSLVEKAIYGKIIYDRFIDKTVGYKELQAEYQKQAKEKGYVYGLDGRKLHVRSPHSVLNLIFQGAAAVITKYWVRETHKRIAETDLRYLVDYVPNAIIHDEQQLTIRNDRVHQLGEILTGSAQVIHEQLNLNVPMDAQYKFGPTWWDTH